MASSRAASVGSPWSAPAIAAPACGGRSCSPNAAPWVEMVGLCDSNPLRLERARELIGTDAPLFDDLATMLREARPDTVIVCSRDSDHDEPHRRGARGRLRRRHREADDHDARRSAAACWKPRRAPAAGSTSPSTTAIAPTAARLKELLLSGVIGEIVSVDFHWYLDT